MSLPHFLLKKKARKILPVLIFLSILSGCAGLPEEPLHTATPSPTLPATATIDWFPATSTPTRAPTHTVQPTPDQRPARGEVVLTDDFTHEDTWQTIQNNQGGAAFGKGDLTIAISTPGGTIASLNKEAMLTDFYLEITMSPSLCRGDDAYGLLFRAANSLDNYRLLINCSGMVRLERMIAGKPVPLRDWEPSGQVPPGSPLEIRVGVWVVRNELRFFINDFYQFNARDPVHKMGGIGVFARSGGKNALTVSFSDLVVWDINQSQVPTFAPPTPRPTITPQR
ncbi:MAG: hypothetical protein AB9891_04640 [Anaerolineaceae bacterium]